METKSLNNRRYYLHSIIKGTIKYDPYIRTMYIAYDKQLTDYPTKIARAVKKLQGIGYALQTEII